MSHEVMSDVPVVRTGPAAPAGALDPGLVADLDPPAPRAGPAAPPLRPPVAGSPVAGSPVAGSPVAGSPVAGSPVAGSPRAPEAGTRRAGAPVVLVAVALTALGLGAFAGNSQARHTARDQLAAGTRVLLWADSVPVPGDGGSGSLRLQATLASAGSPVTLQRIDLGVGEGSALPEVSLRPGTRASTQLELHSDCAALTRSGPDPALLDTARATVRLPGSRRTREVPLDLVGDPSSVLLSLMAPCTTGAYPGEGAASGAPPLAVSGMAAAAGGTLTFTVSATTGGRAGFDLAIAEREAGSVRFAISALPALPLRVTPSAPVTVTVRLVASCTPATTALPNTYGLLQPQIRLRGSAQPELPVEGWDDGIAAEAMTAAAIQACAAPSRN